MGSESDWEAPLAPWLVPDTVSTKNLGEWRARLQKMQVMQHGQETSS